MWLGPAPWAPYHPYRCHYRFRFISDYSGGDVTNWGAHHLDIAQWALGADDSGPVEVQGHGKRNAGGLHDTFYDINLDFTYAGGVKVELRSGGTEVKTGSVRFEGTKGWILVSRDRIDAEPKALLTSRIGPDEIHLAPRGGSSTHMGIWLDCVRTRNARGLNAPVEVGHRSATVCHLANIAMELGRKLPGATEPRGQAPRLT
jgi:predicted dehydrogenase